MITKAGVVLHIITGLDDGGAEAVLYRLCINDRVNTHCIISLTSTGKYGPLLSGKGMSVYCLNMPRGRITFRGLWNLWRLLRLIQPATVQTWMYHADLIGGVMARLTGIKFISWGVHNSNLARGTVKLSTICVAHICAKLSHFIPARIICCSQQAAVAHQAMGYAADKFTIIPNGYNLEQFAPDHSSREQLRSKWDINSGVPLMGMVARFDPQKDIPNLLAALREVISNDYNFRCVLVGTGMEKNNAVLVNWLAAAGLDDKVILLGIRNDIPAIMNAIDFHILSSLGEAFPNVIAEAMACGTPCITTDVGDAALIVGETGWVVPRQNPKALADAIIAALDAMKDITHWKHRQLACRQRIVDNFSIERMVTSYQQEWQNISRSL